MTFNEIISKINIICFFFTEWDYFPKKYKKQVEDYINVLNKDPELFNLNELLKRSCNLTYAQALTIIKKQKQIINKINFLNKDFNNE